MATSSTLNTMDVVAHSVVTDLTVSTGEMDLRKWCRIEKELCQDKFQQGAWLYVAVAKEEDVAAKDLLVVKDIRVGEPPSNLSPDQSWEYRPGGIWLSIGKVSGDFDQAVTDVDVLFGVDAVDPRPQWALMRSSLQLSAEPEKLVARLTVLHGRAKPRPDLAALRVGKDGNFKFLQISDTHMGTGPGVCKDAIGADGMNLPQSEADPLTVKFIEEILDVEKPDFVALTGDQVHHDVPDSQTALFKLFDLFIKRSTAFAALFGNHDCEGKNALSRTAQMSILQNLPFSHCEPGPEHVDGIGNFYLQVLAPAPSQLPLATLYFLDSHGQIPSKICNPDYDHIKQSQIDWFTSASQAQRRARERDDNNNPRPHLSVVLLHIPLPEFGDPYLSIRNGHRREPTESPHFNSHFYDALAKEGISAIGCGHDHVNDFCALLLQQTQQDGGKTHQPGPWLCYGGTSGFGGYCSYGEKRFYRRARVWELNTSTGSLKTWMRVEYAKERVNELVLVNCGAVIDHL